MVVDRERNRRVNRERIEGDSKGGGWISYDTLLNMRPW